MRKRIWAVLLAICLLVGLLPTAALAGGLTVYKTYAELVAALENPTEEIYLEPAENFGWPGTGTLSIPANTQIVVIDENEEKAPWEIPGGITVNFEQNTHGISCSTLTVNGTMHKAYSSQGGLDFDTLVIGPTGVFSCEEDREGYPTVASVHIAAGETLVVQKGADMNARVRLDGTLTGAGTVSGQVEVSGGFDGTDSNATLSGDLTLTGGLIVGHEYLDSYADQLTIPAGSHITAKNLCWTSIDNATLNLNGTLEFKRDSADSGYSNPYINAGGKIVMNGGRLVLNTPYRLQEGVLDWEEGEIITYAKIQAAIPTPLISGTGTIYFNDSESAAGEEYGWIFDCYADDAVVAADAVKAGTYDADKFDPMSWTLVCAIDLENITIEHSWIREHNWVDGEVLTEPTCTEPGKKLLTCTDCGETKIAVIPATGHTYGENGICTACGAEEVQYDVSNIRFSDEGADHPLLVWDCTPAEGVTCNVYVTYDGGAEWELFESEIADAVCDIMEPGMDGVNGIKIEMVDSDGTAKVIATDVTIRISAEETTELKDLTGTVSDFGDDKNFSWTISGFSGNTLVWVNFTDADGSIRSGLANVCTAADGSLSDKTPYGAADHDTDNIYIGKACEYEDIAVQNDGKTLSYTMKMVGENIKLAAESATPTDVVLYVNGVDMANGGTVDGVAYNAATNTLTLTNASITSYYADADAGTRAGIYYKGADPLNIELSGENTVSISCTSDQIGYGIDSSGPVTITGSGTLAFQTQTDGESTKGYGATAILATDLVVTDGAVVTANLPTVGTDDNLGTIVSLLGDLTVSNDASLTATGKYEAVKTSGNVSIVSGGSLTVKAIKAVIADGSVTVENGSFTADAVGTSANMGYSVKFAGDMTISGDSAQVLVNQSTDANYAYGLYNTAACDLTISGGTVKIANGSNGTHQAIRLQNSASTFTMTGGDVTVTGGTGLYYGLYNAGTVTISGGVLRHTGDLYIGGLTTLSGEANVTVNGAAYLNGLTMQDSAALDVTNSTGTAVTSSKAVQVTGGTLTASGTSDALNITGGDLTMAGGTVDLTGGRYGLYLSNTNGGKLVYESGVLSASGSNGGVVWFSWDTDFSANPPASIAEGTPITPAGAKLLTATISLEDNQSAYAAAYVAADTDALTYEGTTVTNAVQSITFGAAPNDVVLYVNGEDMVNGGEVTGAAYDADTNTLTLNGANITNYYTIPLTGSATDPRAGIYYQGEEVLNIVVSGGSTISVVPGVTGTGTAIPAFGIYADGPVNVQLNSYLNIQPGTADGAESDNKSDQGAKVLGGAVYVTGNMTVAGSSFLRYLNFGTFRYQSGTSGLQTANNHQMPFQVDGNLTVSNGPTIMGGEMKVGGNASVAGELDLTAVVGNYQKVSNGISTVYAADATLDVGGTLDLTGGSVTIGSGCTRANYAGLKAGTLRQSGGTLTLNNDEKNCSIQCDDLVQTGGTLTANCVVEAGSSAHLSRGTLTAAALIGTAITVDGTADVNLTGISSGASMGGLGANITISGGTVDITGQSFGIQTANLTVTGGTTTVTAPVALSFSDILKRNGGNFTVTGGTLKLVAEGDYYGSTIAIRWDDVSCQATADTHFEPNVTVPVSPSGAKFLETVNDVGLYAATYVAEDVDAIIVSGGYASNGLTAITFGVEPCTDHVWGDWAVTKEATCTEAGTEKRTCTECGTTETREIAALGHTKETIPGKEATCTETGLTDGVKCSVCGEILTAQQTIQATGHTEIADPAVAATCTTDGKTEGKHCSVCGEVLTAQEVIPATGHTAESVPGKEATCTETGLTPGEKCSVCGEILTAQETIPAKGHTEVVDAAVEATCTETGLTEGKHCSVCNEVLVAQEVVPAKGHTSTESDCTKQDVCGVCGTVIRPAGTHVCTYTASGAVLTETCGSCDHTATATLSVSGDPFSYTGTAITPASVAYGTGWQSGDLTIAYSNNTRAGTATASVTLGGTTASVTFTIDPASQTLSWSGAEGSLSTTYGTPIAGKTAVKDKADGGAITYTSSDNTVAAVDSTTGTLTIVGVGEAKITASAPAVEGKYTASAPIEYYVTVSAKRVTVTADAKTRAYGSENPALTFTVPEGTLVGSDTAADLGVTLATQANQTSPVGEYDITGSGSGKNYAVTVTPGTLTVTPASLTVKPKDVTIYVGDALPTQLELAYTGLVNGDTLTPAGTPAFTLKNGDAELADSKTTGTYTILWTNPEEVTFDNTNYSVTKEATGTLTISQKSSGGGGGGSAAVTPDEPEITTGGGTTVAEIETKVTTSGTTSKAAVSQDALDQAIEAAESASEQTNTNAAVEIVVETPAKATEVKVDLPAEGLENFADSEAQSLTISSGVGTVTISPEAAASIAEQAQGDTVTITISEVTQPEKTLNERQLAAVGDAPVYDLSVTSNGKYISQFDGGLITVSLPYTLKAGEDPNGVVVYYVDDLGNIQRVRAMYDVKTQSIIFTTNHFSFYMVRYESDVAAAARFTDVPFDAYYQSAVGWAVNQGVTSGMTETTFAPNAACTRAQAVTFLWRAAGSPAPKSSVNPFADVKADAYYYEAVLWAVENGITKGTTDTAFSPNATCTRAQIVTFLWRAQKSPAADSVNPFTDVAADAYYNSAVLWAVEHGITSGTTAATFSPNNNCTRAQIVTFLYRSEK